MRGAAKCVHSAFALLLVLTGCAGTADPEQASERFASVRVECTLELGGGLSDCRILSETPPGMGFGEAALAAAGRSRVPAHTDGTRQGAKVQWNIRFRLAEPTALDLQPPRA